MFSANLTTKIAFIVFVNTFLIILSVADSVIYEIEHSFSSGKDFTTRQSLEAINPIKSTEIKAIESTYDFNAQQRENFLNILDIGGFYQIRTRSVPSDPQSPYVVSSIRACEFARANFKQNLALHLDSEGNVVSLESSARLGKMATKKSCSELKVPEAVSLKTFPEIVFPTFTTALPIQVQGPSKPVAGMPNIDVPKEKKEGEPEKPEEKSFFQKYWIYIVLAIIFLSGGGGEEPAQGGQAQGGQPQGGGGGGGGGAPRRGGMGRTN